MTPIRIGLDIAKNVFQVHGVDDKGTVVIRKRLRRPDILRFFASLPPCLIGIEACSASHHWPRELIRLGHEVRLMPARSSRQVDMFADTRVYRNLDVTIFVFSTSL